MSLAVGALEHGRPRASQLAFTFKLTMPARVRVTLARQVSVHGHTRWETLPYTLTIAAVRGRNRAHLNANKILVPGRYRLTLTPLHGRARMLTFRVG